MGWTSSLIEMTEKEKKTEDSKVGFGMAVLGVCLQIVELLDS